MKEKTLAFNFRIVYVEGGSSAIKAANAMSRHAIDCEGGFEEYDDIEMIARAHAAHQASAIESVTWDRVKDVASTDKEYVALVNLILEGFPTAREELPDSLKRYWSMRDELYVIENVPFKDRKMLIPQNLRSMVVEGLHAAHQGVSNMLLNARLGSSGQALTQMSSS